MSGGEETAGNGEVYKPRAKVSTSWVRSSFCQDGGCIDVRQLADSTHDLILMKSSVLVEGQARVLVVSKIEFTAFVQGVKAGEFDAFM